jgi:hypothetical protein
MIPGWPYSIVAALETGRTSWTAVLDTVRLGPDDDAAAVTAVQLREVVERLIVAGQHRPGDPPIEIVMDSGYDVTLIRLQVDHLPGDRAPRPLWLWTSRPQATAQQVDHAWQGFLRRFDLERTFRFFKQQLGRTAPSCATPQLGSGRRAPTFRAPGPRR